MCGISLFLCGLKLVNPKLLDQPDSDNNYSYRYIQSLHYVLSHRGPDSYKSLTIQVNSTSSLTLTASVLHLRGTKIIHQPIHNTNKTNIFLWNGEVFDGLQMNNYQNDTQLIFDLLINAKSNEMRIMNIFKSIEGPFAFIYYDVEHNNIYFARDRLGRRSLLYSINSITNEFKLSSVAYSSPSESNSNASNSQVWNELPNDGIFKLDLNTKEFSIFSWKSKSDEFLSNSNILETKNETITDSNQNICQQNRIHSNLNCAALFPSIINTHSICNETWIEKYFQNINYNEIKLAFLNIFCQSIRKRVYIPKSSKMLRHQYLSNDIQIAYRNMNELKKAQLKQQQEFESSIAILYSGGIDSQFVAALVDKYIPDGESIDLINVVCGSNPLQSPDRMTAINGLIELQTYINPKRKWRLIEVNVDCIEKIIECKNYILSLIYPSSTVMDFNIGNILWFGARGIGHVYKLKYKRISNHSSIRYTIIDQKLKKKYEIAVKNGNLDERIEEQLMIDFPNNVNSISRNIDFKQKLKRQRLELHKKKKKRAKLLKREYLQEIKHAIYGESKNDLSLDNFYSIIENSELYVSAARVVLLGFGSDELMGGYGRHRTAFQKFGENGLRMELNKDFERLWKRNLGRDDRLISDHGRECRWPFLDEQLIEFLQLLPIEYICDLTLAAGIGDKKLLRDCSEMIGLKFSRSLVKRAMQFGSRIANRKINGKVVIDDSVDIMDIINLSIFQ